MKFTKTGGLIAATFAAFGLMLALALSSPAEAAPAQQAGTPTAMMMTTEAPAMMMTGTAGMMMTGTPMMMMTPGMMMTGTATMGGDMMMGSPTMGGDMMMGSPTMGGDMMMATPTAMMGSDMSGGSPADSGTSNTMPVSGASDSLPLILFLAFGLLAVSLGYGLRRSTRRS